MRPDPHCTGGGAAKTPAGSHCTRSSRMTQNTSVVTEMVSEAADYPTAIVPSNRSGIWKLDTT